jgi:hypothetical protein
MDPLNISGGSRSSLCSGQGDNGDEDEDGAVNNQDANSARSGRAVVVSGGGKPAQIKALHVAEKPKKKEAQKEAEGAVVDTPVVSPSRSSFANFVNIPQKSADEKGLSKSPIVSKRRSWADVADDFDDDNEEQEEEDTGHSSSSSSTTTTTTTTIFGGRGQGLSARPAIVHQSSSAPSPVRGKKMSESAVVGILRHQNSGRKHPAEKPAMAAAKTSPPKKNKNTKKKKASAIYIAPALDAAEKDQFQKIMARRRRLSEGHKSLTEDVQNAIEEQKKREAVNDGPQAASGLGASSDAPSTGKTTGDVGILVTAPAKRPGGNANASASHERAAEDQTTRGVEFGAALFTEYLAFDVPGIVHDPGAAEGDAVATGDWGEYNAAQRIPDAQAKPSRAASQADMDSHDVAAAMQRRRRRRKEAASSGEKNTTRKKSLQKTEDGIIVLC